jgi:hypothetical protein
MRFSQVAMLAVAALVAAPTALQAQGPIREGLRATGEAAANVAQGAADVTRGVVRGTGEAAVGVAQGAADVTRGVVRGTGQAAAGVAQGAADVTRGVVGGAAQGIRAGVNAVTPILPWQARAGANLQAGDAARDARWRFARHNGEWWYYSPENAWMYHRDGNWNSFSQDNFTPNPQFSGEYAMGYRGDPQATGQFADEGYGVQGGFQGPVYQLRRDEYGREFICDNGQRVYFDDGQEAAAPDQQQAGMTPTPAIPTEAGYAPDQAQESTGTAPVTPQPPTSGDLGDGASEGFGQASGPGPESPREINNEPPSPNQSGDATTSGTGDGDTLQ